MKELTNRFGTGKMYDIDDIGYGECIQVVCTACMSVWSDFLSYANSDNCMHIVLSNYWDVI